MTKREIAILSFKVLSIYAFISVIDKLPYILESLSRSGVIRENLLMIIIPPTILALCGIILWKGSPYLASILCKSTIIQEEPSASLKDIQAAAFSVVGLYILANALPECVNVMVVYNTSYGDKVFLSQLISILLLKSCLGLLLLFGSRGIVNFVHSMRRD
jgi:hypothetical protein